MSSLTFPNVYNIRDLGGIYSNKYNKKIRSKKIIRSSEISSLQPSDWDLLFIDYNVRHLFDLRRKDEQLLYPINIPKKYENLIFLKTWDFNSSSIEEMDHLSQNIREALRPLLNMNDEELEIWTQSKYQKYHYLVYMCEEHYKGIFQEMIKISKLNQNECIIIFCGAGKDRTGFIIAFILELLGIDREIILNDYELTTLYYKKNPPTREYLLPLFKANGLDELPMRVVDQLCFARREEMKAALNNLTENKPLIDFIKETYLLNDEEIQNLQNYYLE